MKSQRNKSPKSTKFLILDLYTASNRGDAAILEGLLYSLKKEVPHSQFIIHTWYPDLVEQMPDRIVHRSLITHFIGSYRATLRTLILCLALMICSLLASLKLNISFILPRRYRVPFSDFLLADVIVGMGGAFYNDNYWQALPGRLCHLWIGKLLRKPVVISAHSFGPFNRKIFQLAVRLTFGVIESICVRDEASLQVLNVLKIPASKIHKVADSAWLLDEISKDEARRLLDADKIDLSQPILISLSARRWPYYRTVENQQGHARYVEALAKALDVIIENHQAGVFFLSTCYEADIQVGHEIKKRLRHSEKFHIISEDYEPSQLKGIYGLMDLHIGTRMHSVIFALSAGTPCLGISYEPKLLSLMEEIRLKDYVVEIEEIDTIKILAGIKKISTNRASLMGIIQYEIARLQILAQENASIIAQFAPH